MRATRPSIVPVALVDRAVTTGDAMAPRAGVFYPSADAQGGGTLCLAPGLGGEAVLAAAAMPFVIPEKTGADVGRQPEAGYTIAAPIIAAANPYFRRVLYTTPDGRGQLTAMTLQPRENIGLEYHAGATQLISVQEGAGTARVGNQLYHVGPGALIIVPANVVHDVNNTSDTDTLHLLVFYTNALHRPGLVEPTKASAALSEGAGSTMA